MKKIIRIIDRLNVGGPSIHVSILSGKLNSKKLETILISGFVCKEEGDMSYVAKKYNVEPLYVSELAREIDLFQDFIALWKIFWIIKKERPHIVHTHKSKAGFIGRIAAILAGVPVIIHTFHGHIFHGYFSELKTKFFITIERILALFTTKIIVISKEQFNEICHKYKIGFPRKYKTIPLGFSFANLEEISKQRGWLREKYNWQKTDIVIGIIGRLASIKNHKMFLEVAQKINQQRKNVKFIIIGDGELRENLEQLRESLNLQKCVAFTGWLKEPTKIYSDIDIVALTSLNEGTPVVLIEGMYYKKPVVATNVGGVVDIVDNTCGYVSDVNNIDQFSCFLLKLIDNEEKRAEMAENGHQKIKKIYSYHRLIADIELLYSELLSRV